MGLTQDQFRKKVNLAQSAISQYEKGERTPSSTALQKIAKGLNLPLSDLLDPDYSFRDSNNNKDALIRSLSAKLRKLREEQILDVDRSLDFMLNARNNEE